MADIKSEQDIRQLMESVVSRVLPAVIRETVNNIRKATVSAVNNTGRTVNVRIARTNEEITNIRFQRGASDVAVGDVCYIIAEDPTQKGNLVALVV
jgi:hypothetical protein